MKSIKEVLILILELNPIYIYIILSDCGPLFAPVNGFVDTSMGTTYGNIAAYSCSPGHTLTGPGIVLCQDNGVWDPAIAPTCLVKSK